VVFVDLGDGLTEAFLGRDLAMVLAVLAPPTTTLVLGAASFDIDGPESSHDRPWQQIDLDAQCDDGPMMDSRDGKALQR
jgi:hypothetical protein